VRLGAGAALVDGELVPGDVEIEGGVVRAVGVGASGGRGRIAAPGFVDLHVNGFGGVDLLGADAGGWARAGAALLRTGVTAYRPTFITAPRHALVAALRAMPRGGAAEPPRGAPRLLGAHLEGPFLAEPMLRVHPPEHRRDPDEALLEELLTAGPVAQVTLAPELPGALELVDRLVARGVTAAAGHSDATAAQAHAAFDRGVSTVVHLFNAMRAPAAREPGLAGAALAREDVTVQLIADGIHVAGDLVRIAFAAAPGRLALVTDAVAAANAPDGGYALGTLAITAAGGRASDAQGRLAGSTLTMDAAVRHVHALGIGLAEALTAATAVPAAIARRPDLGRLAPGAAADVVLLDDALRVERVLVGGVDVV
jgi:N-acetylglucosamine-6-phosphate deacetylase